jgi:hypothetical protein
MKFKQKYVLTPKHLTCNTLRRSGQPISPAVKFIVAHDTGNPGSTADNNVKYYENTKNEKQASAHIFIDDKEIIECIPALTTNKPEKAWHVFYNLPTDNNKYGCDANDAAIGVEYCHGDNINADEAYSKYIWTIAYICFKFNLDPKTSIIGHHILDPGRRTDPAFGLKKSGRTYEQLLSDIVLEYEKCLIDDKLNLEVCEPWAESYWKWFRDQKFDLSINAYEKVDAQWVATILGKYHELQNQNKNSNLLK